MHLSSFVPCRITFFSDDNVPRKYFFLYYLILLSSLHWSSNIVESNGSYFLLSSSSSCFSCFFLSLNGSFLPRANLNSVFIVDCNVLYITMSTLCVLHMPCNTHILYFFHIHFHRMSYAVLITFKFSRFIVDVPIHNILS